MLLQILRAKLYDIQLEAQNAEIYAQRKGQIGSGGRSEKIRTYNYKDNRVSDHRINANFPLSTFIDGTTVGEAVAAMQVRPAVRRCRWRGLPAPPGSPALLQALRRRGSLPVGCRRRRWSVRCFSG